MPRRTEPNPAESITFVEEGRDDVVVEFEMETTLLELALSHRVDLAHSCGGMASCGTCRVIVLECPVPLEPRNDLELDMANDRGFAENERLACQTVACPGLKVRIPV